MESPRIVLSVLIGMLLLAGCNSGDKEMGPGPESGVAADRSQTSGGGPAPMPDASLGKTDGSTSGTGAGAGSVEIPSESMKTLKTGYDSTKAAYQKSPSDAKAKAAYVEAAYKLGLKTEFSELPPREKYRGALELFREVLKVEPGHSGAKVAADQIVEIYKSMGRPVPGGG